MLRRRYLRSLGKRLTVLTMGYGPVRPQDCATIARPIFRGLAPYLVEPVQMLFIRDNPDEPTVTGENTSRTEVLVSVPAWPADRGALQAVFARKLHHLARRQNTKDAATLGAALLREGFAAWYATLMSPWEPTPLSPKDLSAAIRAAEAGWENPYDHAAWFGDGPTAGYALGYALVTRAALGSFNLQASLLDGPTEQYKKVLGRMARDEE